MTQERSAQNSGREDLHPRYILEALFAFLCDLWIVILLFQLPYMR